MNKEDSIKEAFGDRWPLVEKFHVDNGWIRTHEVDREATECRIAFTKEHNIEYLRGEIVEDVFAYWRPESLSGIEHNNGWTTITTITDLPRRSGMYAFITGGDPTYIIKRQVTLGETDFRDIMKRKYSHYREAYRAPIF